ncbi:MAG TPA: ABC transporter permease [Bryobacteraceae bacterium]|jgi:putative ABC transport system permease protein|nr:ABC transporter permease [Bryobacteraceae bacterium]
MFWKKRRSAEDLREEIASHLAHQVDELRDRGRCADPEAAARRAFGNITAFEEASYERRHWMWLDHLVLDLRQAVHQLKKRPGFSVMVVLTLALGIGANSAIFSVIRAVLLRPLPYKDPGRLAMLFADDPARELHEGRTSLLNFADWKKENRSFEDMTVFTPQTFLLGTEGAPERMRAARVPANFWPVLGVQPILGRVFTADEEKRAERVVVLSYGLWQRQFGGLKEAIGASLVMDGRNYRVIGVMPPEFRFPFPDTSVWEPITAHPYWATRDLKAPRSNAGWLVLGRLKPGVTWAQAREDLNAITSRLRAEYPAGELPERAFVVPLKLVSTRQYQLSLWLLFGSVLVMLLIGCVNIAGLLLARGIAREREFALRQALGAKRTRIAAQLVTETLTLASCGGLVGLLLAGGITQLISAYGPAGIPRLSETQIDWQVVLFTAGVTICTALFASLWPVLHSTNRQLGSRPFTSVSTHRTRNFLVIAQFALALLLMTTAGLLIHSFLRVRATELGFRPDHLLVMRIDLHVGKTVEQQASYFEQAIERAESLPGVRSAAAISGFLRTDPEDSVQIEGHPLQHPGPCEDLITGRYFQTAGVRLLRGRSFSSRDRRGSLPVAIVNEAMARAYWPNGDPIGKRFRFKASDPWLTVVGVAGDMRRQGMERPIAPQVFLPHRQGEDNMMDVIVRTTGDPAKAAALVRGAIQALDKSVAKFKVSTVDEELAQETSERRFNTFLVGSFAFAALFLSAIGIYGLLHQLVVQRTSEIAVRMALGARPNAVQALVLRQGLALALVGALLGLTVALFAARFVSKLLYEVAPTDPIALGGSVLLLLAVAGIACWMPSVRAARIDPMRVLRQE